MKATFLLISSTECTNQLLLISYTYIILAVVHLFDSLITFIYLYIN